MANNIWGETTLQDGQIKHISIGDLHLWMKYQDEEIWIAHAYSDELKGDKVDESLPEDIGWARWTSKSGSREVKIQPVFPDLPLIVHSEYTLTVSRDTKIQIYSRFPIWIRISQEKDSYLLTELPTVKLSRTWFGTPVEGELCYHAVTKARRDLSHVDKKPYVVSCPIIIHNKSHEDLDFEHFCFRAERLSMYEYEGDFWADETQIIYHGEEANSDVIMTGKLPKGIDKKNLVSKPRKAVQRSLATRTFKRIFEDTLKWGQ